MAPLDNITSELSSFTHTAKKLQLNHIHLWYIPFSNCLTSDNSLSSDEKQRASSFNFSIHKNKFIAYRATLRKILSSYYNNNPKDLTFGYTKYSKPYILHNPNNIQFNLSHSHEMAILAITMDRLIGIDIEYIKPLNNIQEIAKKFFAQVECDKLISLSKQEQLECFYDIWTKKEAFIKAIGEGLSYPLDQFTVSSHDDLPDRIIEINHSTTKAKEWLLNSFNLEHDNKIYKIACSINNPSHHNFIYKNFIFKR